MIEIRQENIKDYEEVYNVIKRAFETAEHRDGNEHDLVNELRKGDSFIPKLSLVAIKENKIVGYILFTKIKIGEYEEITLAPLAVLPEYQKQGIGSKLIEEGHRIAKELGYHYSVFLGSEKYYPKFGYIPAIAVGHIAANNGKYLSNKNSKKINVVNFFVIYLIMSYYINIINSIFQLIFRVDDSIKLLSNIGILLMWVGIVLIAYKIINKNNYVENE